LDKKFTTLLGDVKRWLDAIENHVLEQSVAKLKKSHEKQALVEFGNMEKKEQGKKKDLKEKKKRLESEILLYTHATHMGVCFYHRPFISRDSCPSW
jgi:regulator of replication initiation timing